MLCHPDNPNIPSSSNQHIAKCDSHLIPAPVMACHSLGAHPAAQQLVGMGHTVPIICGVNKWNIFLCYSQHLTPHHVPMSRQRKYRTLEELFIAIAGLTCHLLGETTRDHPRVQPSLSSPHFNFLPSTQSFKKHAGRTC